ncbi:MAG TPA: tetraacyldisaccharide 4'-kinase [Terriglobia bacterium]|nr:tetraacyldisaccharide 4'-kinase [Terriglobia bacterium]
MNRLLMPVASLYGFGARVRRHAYDRGWFESRRLSRPVISVGNLTLGGSGKTPLVGHIARLLVRNRYKPSILTRGYGRVRGKDIIALDPQPNRAPDPRSVGDEPALLARALPEVPIVICSDRYRAGRLAEERYGVDVHILDDGFQHLSLAREVDLVAVDLTRNVFHEALFPAGRMREPASALARANLIVLTRSEIGDAASMEKQIRRINPEAPIFRCETSLLALAELGGRREVDAAQYHGKPACAFCAIGNPSAFFADLRRWGFHLVAELAFRDHHVYHESDLLRISRTASETGAAFLITTEKDVMNLPPQVQIVLPVLACEIQAKILDVGQFEKVLLARLSSNQLPSRVVLQT